MPVMTAVLLHIFLLKFPILSETENNITIAWIQVLGLGSFRRITTE